jgi:hypothetical protein
MAITLETFDTTATLENHQAAIRQMEKLGFRVVSLTTGHVGGGRANIITLSKEAGAPSAEITLETVDGALDRDAQQGNLNRPGRQLVCYGSLFVGATARNVAAWRA